MSTTPAPRAERLLYFDCFSGLSGDMTLGALIDLGLAPEVLWQELAGLNLSGYTARAEKIQKQGLVGTKVRFTLTAPQPPRRYRDILRLIEQAPLPPPVQEMSRTMFRLLAEVEAQVHQVPVAEVHFHEVGAVDSILDVVGTALGCHLLGITQVYASPLPLGRGTIASAHGRLPNPAPATTLLLAGAPVYGTDLAAELVTPTGAAILRGLGAQFTPLPPFTLEKVGYGAGDLDLPGQPNLLRLILGRPTLPWGRGERILVLETHLDDMLPEWYEHLMDSLFQAGALDVAYYPLQMKKNRPGVGLIIVAPLFCREAILETLFTESTTLGVRVQEMDRIAVNRWQEIIATPYGPLQVKVADLRGRRRLLPEYEACRALAKKHNLPLLEVYRLVAPDSGKPED
ncbi:MAG: nickel pincer cofactor biosynthesis protein LarC [Desulfobacca sp.]|uniref:nickel pincer cofactor biosynthesis protein LarC n=1 Tax=Desulfobacca sp. TaxID=2067990 RepID=UPI0040492A92